jgi:aldehyde dehydrogenase (NAD+)
MAPDEPRLELDESDVKQRHAEAASVVPSPARMYVGGEWVGAESGDTFETRDPTTGEVLATVPAGDASDVDRAVAAATEAYENRWSDANAADRQEVLDAIADRIEDNQEELATLETLDNGKSLADARIDMGDAAAQFRYFAGATRSLEGKALPHEDGRIAHTLREPYGVVGGIVPWNFPLSMAAYKLAPAVAAGNCMVLKPAEQTPLTTVRLAELVDDVVPDGVINLVTGYGPDAGEPLVEHPDVHKLAFTGSTEVGREVMRTAADHLAAVTLELGGKNPVIIYPDTDLEEAAEVATMSIFPNAGQSCSAGSRVFVHSDAASEFLGAFEATTRELVVGDPLVEETDIGPQITADEAESTLTHIAEAESAGARIRIGGGRPEDPVLSDRPYVLPTIVEGIDHDHSAVQEEIFGPVVEIFEWDDYDEMIALANDVEYGLAAGVLTQDIDQAYRTANDLEAGFIWVNQYHDYPFGLPYGGYKQSGVGRERAAETMNHYTRTKSIDVSID